MYQLKRKQIIKTDLKSAWDFFSSPLNLKRSPQIIWALMSKTELPEKMYEGLMIEYTVNLCLEYQ